MGTLHLPDPDIQKLSRPRLTQLPPTTRRITTNRSRSSALIAKYPPASAPHSQISEKGDISTLLKEDI